MDASRIFPDLLPVVNTPVFFHAVGDMPHAANKKTPVSGSLSDGHLPITHHALMIPLRIAYLTSSERECRFNFRMMFSRWRSTVFGLMTSDSAIS